MRRHSLSIGIFAIGLLAGVTTAQAAVETWVSGTGNDAGACPRTAPCRTFAYAHSKTNDGGTLNVLTAGNFGPVTITKTISIVAQGVEALIDTVGTGVGADAAITVQAGGTRVVSLRGLTIDLRGANKTGILFFSGAALHVHNTVVRRSSAGIEFQPSTGNPELFVADSVIANTSGTGFFVVPNGSAGPRLTLDRVRVENGAGTGIHLQAGGSASITATVRDSVVAGNDGGIMGLDTGSSGPITVMVDRTAVVNNGAGTGILALGSGVAFRLGDSTITGNGFGINPSGGAILSYGNNKIDGNGSDGAPSGGVIPMK